jgi:hypothetical protein
MDIKSYMLEWTLKYLVCELVAGARSARGEITHVLEHRVEAHAGLLTQLLLNTKTTLNNIFKSS